MDRNSFYVEQADSGSLDELNHLVLKLWPGTDWVSEESEYRAILIDQKQAIGILKYNSDAIGFIHLTVRSDYVEGTTTSRVAYLEAIYIQPDFRGKS